MGATLSESVIIMIMNGIQTIHTFLLHIAIINTKGDENLSLFTNTLSANTIKQL